MKSTLRMLRGTWRAGASTQLGSEQQRLVRGYQTANQCGARRHVYDMTSRDTTCQMQFYESKGRSEKQVHRKQPRAASRGITERWEKYMPGKERRRGERGTANVIGARQFPHDAFWKKRKLTRESFAGRGLAGGERRGTCGQLRSHSDHARGPWAGECRAPSPRSLQARRPPRRALGCQSRATGPRPSPRTAPL